MEHQLERNLSEQVEQVISTAETLFHDQILGIYLYGSATIGGLHPDSDIDILILSILVDNIRNNFKRCCCRMGVIKITGGIFSIASNCERSLFGEPV